jgi:hypothetical protein
VGEDPSAGVLWFSAWDTQLNSIILSYRGTDNIQNVIQDINPLMEELENGEHIQMGFLGAIRSSIQTLECDIERILQDHPDSQLLVTGHSAGAAFASIALYLGMQPNGFLRRMGMTANRVSVVTTASPRFGDETFVRRFQDLRFARVDRIANDKDMVPLLPPEQIGFRHVGREILLNQDTNGPIKCPSRFKSRRDGTCSRATKLPMLLAEPSLWVDSHNVYLGIRLGDQGCIPTPPV